MTRCLIDLDAATLILERIKGLLTLLDDHLYQMDVTRKDAIPLNTATFCLERHVTEMYGLLNAGINLEQKGAQR